MSRKKLRKCPACGKWQWRCAGYLSEPPFYRRVPLYWFCYACNHVKAGAQSLEQAKRTHESWLALGRYMEEKGIV